jgi:hypothetical protein
MRKNLKWLVAVVLMAAFLGGCAYAVAPVSGGLYTGVRGPWTATGQGTALQVGTASCYSLLGMVAVGDASIEAAAKSGNITKIHHVDHETVSLLGIYAKFTTYVYGE